VESITQNYTAQWQQILQAHEETLHKLLEQSDKRALITKLDIDVMFPVDTLYLLLNKAFLQEGSGVVARMLDTKSYAPYTLAKVILLALHNEKERTEQGAFISQIMKEMPRKVETIIKLLNIVTETGGDNDITRIAPLIKSAALGTGETEQITNVFPCMREFLLPEQWDIQNANGEIALTGQDYFSEMAPEIKFKIGNMFEIRDLLRYGGISQDFNGVMEDVLNKYTDWVNLHEDLTVSVVAALKKVPCLQLEAPNITDAQMIFIGQLTNLRALDIGDGSITDDELHHLENLTDLELLSLTNTDVTDDGLQYVRNLLKLRDISLMFTHVTDDGLAHLGNLPNLNILNLEDSKVTGAGFQHNGQFLNLQDLDLVGTEITNAELPYVGNLSNLRVLNLRGTGVTGAALHHLGNLLKLDTLYLGGIEVSDAEEQHLRNLLPNLNIYR